MPRLHIWQTSDRDDDEIRYWHIKRTDDVTAATETLDTVDRWIEATTATLAAKVFEKLPPEIIGKFPAGFYSVKSQQLATNAREALYFAQTEDRDKASLTFSPIDYAAGI